MESQRKNFWAKSWFKTLKEAGGFCRVGTAWPICCAEVKRRNLPQHKTEDPGSYIYLCLYHPRRLLLSSWKWQTSCGLILHETELWEARWLLVSPGHTQPPSFFLQYPQCSIFTAILYLRAVVKCPFPGYFPIVLLCFHISCLPWCEECKTLQRWRSDKSVETGKDRWRPLIFTL